MVSPLLDVQDLRVAYPTRGGGLDEVVRGVSFVLYRERLGIVGESGSGKSQTGRAILGLTAPGGVVSAKMLRFDGIDLLSCPERQRRSLRGGRIAMVLQDPKYALDPVMRIGAQIAETLRAHSPARECDVQRRVHESLAAVGVDDPARMARLYPHEVSGGMGQRAMIAMMLIAGPELLIADEPTSALDYDARENFIRLLFAECREAGSSLLFVSHDQSLAPLFDRHLSLAELNRAATSAEV